MSVVELPHVPSARAPSSAASSTRRSLHSAGSTASHASSKSLRHSFGAGEEEDHDDDEGEGGDESEEEEEPHESSSGSGSGGLWDEVESFLNKPSPSFAALAKDGGAKSATAGSHVLPTLQYGDRRQPVVPSGGGASGGGGNQSGARSNRPSRAYARQPSGSLAAGSRAIDPKLLQEAFAYAERIQRVNFDDDDDNGEGDQQREADKRGVGVLRRDTSYGSASAMGSSGPRMPQDAAMQKQGSLRGKTEDKAKKKKSSVSSSSSSKASAYGASIKPQAAKKKSIAAGSERGPTRDASEWDASPSSADPIGDSAMNSRKGSFSAATMDQQTVQSLVSNLQNGTALDELRRELAASQQSMAMSRQVIQEAAKSFFHVRK